MATRTKVSVPPALDAVHMSDELRALAERGVPKLVPKGRRLITEGEFGTTLYIILAGRLRAFSAAEDGARDVTYGEYTAGEFVGELNLDDGPRAADIEAMQPSWVILITRETLMRHIAEYPEFARQLLAKVIRRLRAATLSLRALALNDVYGRVVAFLNDNARSQPNGTRVVGPITQRGMARQLSCTRSMVSKVLKSLQDDGRIRCADHRITLLKPLPTRF